MTTPIRSDISPEQRIRELEAQLEAAKRENLEQELARTKEELREARQTGQDPADRYERRQEPGLVGTLVNAATWGLGFSLGDNIMDGFFD